MSLTSAPVHEVAGQIARGELHVSELVDAYLARIAKHDEKLHAYVEVYEDDAREAAGAADHAIAAGHSVGPLHGIPVAVKDIVDIEGRITTGGSAAWLDRRSPVTATLVRRMVAAGMIVLGKTHTVEFAMGGWGTNQRMGTPWNPWDLAVHRTPGGSSAGTGVAVAGELAPWGIGTDTGGSVRIPAGWCGLAGLKTTVGRISVHGVLPLSHTLDTPGPLARCVEDAASLYEVLAGEDPHDPLTRGLPLAQPMRDLKRGIAGVRLAVMPEHEREGVDAELLARFDEALACMVDLGAEVVTLPALPCSFAEFAELTGRIIFAEGYSYVGDLCEDPTAPLDEDVRPRILTGKTYSARQYLDGLHQAKRIRAEFAETLLGYDALVTPTMLTPAVPLNEVDQSGTPAGFTRVVNFLGRCALTVCNGYTSAGLPSGIQFICDPFNEDMALRIGWAYEQANDWHTRSPNGLD